MNVGREFVSLLNQQLRMACLDEIESIGDEALCKLLGILPVGAKIIKEREWIIDETIRMAAVLRVDMPSIVERVFSSLIWNPSCTAVGNEHSWVQMHHVYDGKHWCPTGFMWCPNCAGTRDATEEENECRKWAEE